MPATAGAVLQAARVRLAAVSVHPRRDAEMLLSHALGCGRLQVLAHPEQLLSAPQAQCFEALLARRIACEPMQYILGEQEFYGLRFHVTPAVLIPRPETEHLVEAALRLPRKTEILDVGTGSGAIAVALASHTPQSHITAVDISPGALAVARRNARRHGLEDRITFLQSDLLASVDACFDVVVSNPPYIAETEVLEPQVGRYEPPEALFAGPTGLEIYQRLIPHARAHLKPEGWLLMEIGAGQSAAVAAMLHSWSQVAFINDLQQIPRVVQAQIHP